MKNESKLITLEYSILVGPKYSKCANLFLTK